MKNIDVFKKGKVLETSPYYSFETEDYTDMSYIIEYQNKMYQVICDSFGKILEPDEECFSFDIEEDANESLHSDLIGMTSDSGMSLSSLFQNVQINYDYDEEI